MESEPLPESTVILTTGNTAVTLDGLTIQNYLKTESIRTRKEIRIVAECRSWQLCRTLRRDFNLVAAKMYMRCMNRAMQEQVVALLAEMRLQAELLEKTCAAFEARPEPFDIRTVPVRLISPESTSLYKTLMTADQCTEKLNWAVHRYKLHSDEVEDYLRDFMHSFFDLKQFVIGSQSSQTAAEMGAERGIG